ncbi:hypothetical protein FPV16_19020 [Methylobacterium sp. W2]|uniref:hypothetical protein n=1 Tax=Methylobacterium sp. W2 TaxID=2598107 RepID=UPI001D0C2A48|nr:hypothetical protein [Methylobacterium sp. W2]MCC0808278.1 hypothetical protein [Methylobacterium sp. W2]
MSPEVLKALEALQEAIDKNSDRAEEFSLLAELAGHTDRPKYAKAFQQLARSHRIKALELQGQAAALRVEHGEI